MSDAKDVFKNKSYRALFHTQFLGALNDNIFKNALVVLIAFKGVTLWGLDTKSVVAAANAIFILPFLLFSALAGQLCDRYQRATIVRFTKWFELGIMAVVTYGFFSHHYSLLMIGLFAMGIHSTLFGPTKYSLIPDLVTPRQLTAGNAYIETGTFLAILIGTILGGLAAQKVDTPFFEFNWGGAEFSFTGHAVIAGLLLAVALIGLITAYGVPRVPIADPDLKVQKNPWPQTLQILKLVRPNRVVFNSILGISWFWFFGAAILSVLPILSKDVLHSEASITLFLATFTIGIGLGSVVCEKLSFQRVEIGLVPWGSLGMTVFLLDLALCVNTWIHQSPPSVEMASMGVREFLAQPGAWRITFDLFMVSVFGGVFTVPLYTLIQERSEARIRSRVIANNNILNSLFMIVSSVLLMAFYAMNLSLPMILAIYAVLNLAVSVYIYSIVPEFTLRFLSWVLARLVYRVRVKGIENIPQNGPALLVCNHVSFVDWLVLLAAIQRPIRFVMYYKFAQVPLLRYLFQHARVIPIAGVQEDRAIFNSAFETVSKELRAGELVCIFPEGGLTRDGEIQTFKRGVEHILKSDAVPVVPMALSGLWGSIFSHKDGGVLTRWPRRIWFHVDVRIGAPVPAAQVTAAELEKRVKNLLEVKDL